MSKTVSQVGCFKVGSKVVVGNSRKVREITALRIIQAGCHGAGRVFADLKGCVSREIDKLSLAGPNGDGVGL